MNKKFGISFGSPIEYNEGVVFLSYDKKPLCLLNKENGVDKIEIEFYQEGELKIPLSEFTELIKLGIEELKIDSPNV